MSILSFLRRLFGKKTTRKSTLQAPILAQSELTPEKQRRIDELCEALFRRVDWISTGKLQLIGLAAVHRMMGKKWPGMAPIVFRIVETAIRRHCDPNDLFFRYKEDSYIVVFADAERDKTQKRAQAIKEEIERELFTLNEPALKELKIKTTIARTKTSTLIGKPAHQAIPLIFYDPTPSPIMPKETKVLDLSQPFAPPRAPRVVDLTPPNPTTPPAQTITVLDMAPPKAPTPAPSIQAAAESPLVLPTLEISPYKSPIAKHDGPSLPEHAYLPLWDVQKKALTTYLPVFKDALPDESVQQKAYIDRLMLRLVSEELARMQEDGRKLFIACPVHYDTLSRFEHYEDYKAQCQKLPRSQQQFLIFIVLEPRVRADADPFMQPLRQHCRHIFAQLPAEAGQNLQYFQEAGFDALSFNLPSSMGEAAAISLFTILNEEAKRSKIARTMAYGIDSLSLMTSITCAGYDYMGGEAIHAPVSKPDSIYRCNHEDIVLALLAH